MLRCPFKAANCRDPWACRETGNGGDDKVEEEEEDAGAGNRNVEDDGGIGV